MTSKSLLLLGLLLFFLLVTICSVLYIDRYNPLLQNLQEDLPKKSDRQGPIPLPAKRMQPVAIESTPAPATTQPVQPQTQTDEHAITQSETVPNKSASYETDKRAQPYTPNTPTPQSATNAEERKPPTSQSPKEKKASHAPQKRKISPKIKPADSVALPITRMQRVVIESSLIDRRLKPLRNGKIGQLDRNFLRRIAKRVRQTPKLQLILRTSSPIEGRKERFLQNIYRYLLQLHVPNEQIAIYSYTTDMKSNRSIVIDDDDQREAIELSLVEKRD